MLKDYILKLIKNYYKHVIKILLASVKIFTLYKRYSKKSIKFIIKLLISFFIFYIYIKAYYGLVLINTKL